MNIAFEAFALSLDKVTGVGNVALKYIEELQKIDRKNRYFVYTKDGLNHADLHESNWTHVDYMTRLKRAKLSVRESWVRLTAAQSREPRAARLAVIMVLRAAKMFLEALNTACFPFWLASSFRKHGIDAYFGTFADFFPLLFPSRTRKLWLVHDLVWKLYPRTQQKRNVLRGLLVTRGMKRADLLLAVSDSTRNDMIRLLNIRSEIITLHNAADRAIFYRADRASTARVKKKYAISGRYILSVCTLEPRKNLPALLDAYAAMKGRERFRLVLVGMSGWKNTELFDMIGRHPAKDRIIVTGYVPAEDLAPLYAGAEVFAFPTFYEGFGLPVLEAMQCGCPVISSTSSSIPEVAGDACVLVDPHDVTALASSMELVLSDKKLRAAMARKGLARSALFSWEKSAARLLEIIEKK
ncbi:MAG: glycosyltransferase family 4 protein [Spirochaetes bacterium]|nr:glycosyltransferase family 4 protein [Spirochaetota bacterium]